MRVWQEIQAVLWQDHPALNPLVANVKSSACVLLRVLAAHLFLITDFDRGRRVTRPCCTVIRGPHAHQSFALNVDVALPFERRHR